MARARRPGTSTTDVPKWDAYHSAAEAPPWESGSHCSHLEAALALHGIQPGLAIEVGCGGGHSTLFLARSGFRALGIDVSPEAIKRATSAAESQGVPLAPSLSALAAAPQGTAAFHAADLLESGATDRVLAELGRAEGADVLFDCQVFHVLRMVDEEGAASAYAALVREGGRLIMLCGAEGEEGKRLGPGPPELTKEEATAALAKAGFRIDTCDLVRFDPTPSYGAVPPLAWLVVATRAATAEKAK